MSPLTTSTMSQHINNTKLSSPLTKIQKSPGITNNLQQGSSISTISKHGGSKLLGSLSGNNINQKDTNKFTTVSTSTNNDLFHELKGKNQGVNDGEAPPSIHYDEDSKLSKK